MGREENELTKAAIEYLQLCGCYVWRANAGGGYRGKGKTRRYIEGNPKGTPDILGVAPDGRMIAVDAKGPTAKTSDEQHAIIESIRSRGGISGTFETLEDLEELIRDG